MKNSIVSLYLALFIIFFAVAATAQDDGQEIDASKPTNFYSLLDNTLENTFYTNQNVMGYRGKLTYAPSEAHLILAELPLLYNDRTEKFGLGDIRVRYFYLPYKNYSKFLGAFGPSVDIFTPTGSLKNGLGSGRWIISPGLTFGLMAADWIQFFPIISYQYASEQVKDVPEGVDNKATHGLTFQVIIPVVFSEKFFVQVTPIYRMNDLGDERQDRYVQEVTAVYSIAPKLQISAFFNGNFTDEIYQTSLGLTVFL